MTVAHDIAAEHCTHHDHEPYDDKHANSPGVRVKESAASSREGAARWLAIHDELLGGLTHALSNRIATISAVAHMIELAHQSDERATHMLRVETDQLENLLQLLRLLPRRDRCEAEPIMASDAARSAIALHTFYPTLREIACELVVDDNLAPAWADPSALQHAIVVALNVAKRATGGVGATRVHICSTPDIVRVDVVRTHTDSVVAKRRLISTPRSGSSTRATAALSRLSTDAALRS